MVPEYNALLEEAKRSKKMIQQKIKKLRKMKKGAADQILHQAHEDAFEQIDCLRCANCCKGTGPMLNRKDIERIAKDQSMKPGDFVERFLRVDEDNDHVFKSMPCYFLDEDNYCRIYDVRPKACREYPHTDRVNQQGILSLTAKNALICPAVAHIFLETEI